MSLNEPGLGRTDYRLALYGAQLEPGGEVAFERGTSVVVVREGKVTAPGTDGDPVARQAGEAWVQRSPSRVVDDGASAWLNWWTLTPADEPMDDEGLLLARVITVDTPTCLLRCDQVAFPPGGVAYLHTHAGPGIRTLISGTLRVETNGEVHEYVPGDSWFEPGPAPVFAASSKFEGGAFLRVLVLPVAYKGRSSITYVREEDRLKPKDQTYSIYLDEEASL